MGTNTHTHRSKITHKEREPRTHTHKGDTRDARQGLANKYKGNNSMHMLNKSECGLYIIARSAGANIKG